MNQLTVNSLADWLVDAQRAKPVLLDVREPWEFELCRLPASLHVPMATVTAQVGTLDPGAETVVICHHGVRSAQVAMYLERSGFTAVHNLVGGIDAWSVAIDPAVRRY